MKKCFKCDLCKNVYVRTRPTKQILKYRTYDGDLRIITLPWVSSTKLTVVLAGFRKPRNIYSISVEEYEPVMKQLIAVKCIYSGRLYWQKIDQNDNNFEIEER